MTLIQLFRLPTDKLESLTDKELKETIKPYLPTIRTPTSVKDSKEIYKKLQEAGIEVPKELLNS